MKSKLVRILGLLILFSLLVSPLAGGSPAAVAAAVQPGTAVKASPPDEGKWQLVDASAEAYPSNGRYIVLLEGESLVQRFAEAGQGVQLNAPDMQTQLTLLQREQDDRLQQISRAVQHAVQPVFRYDVVLNGFALDLLPQEAAQIAALPGVRAVIPDRLEQPLTDAGPTFIGAPALWNGDTPGDVNTQGEGILVGILDTGINFDHPSFADNLDPGYTYPATAKKGVCAAAGAYQNACNNKLIGAYSFTTGETVTPEDSNGHGSHTASTVAGTKLTDVNFNGVLLPFISGVAPRAQIIAYDVCGDDGCWTSASVAAVQQAILDGVDVINFSISGGRDPYSDPVELAFLDAVQSGVFVAASAGNRRTEPTTDGNVNHTSPWVMTVAASSHNRRFGHLVDVKFPQSPDELTGLFAIPGNGPVFGALFEVEIRYSSSNPRGCTPFAANEFLGAVALIERGTCSFAAKVANAQVAGAIGVLVYNNAGFAFSMAGLEATTIPSAMLDQAEGEALRDYIIANSASDIIKIDITALSALYGDPFGDIKADFSFRGPSANNFEVLKPDITAPGLEILAAVADGEIAPGSTAEFELYQGTSMSSPHVAGAAALMMALRPTWSPAQVKSALMLTAKTSNLLKEDRATPADLFDHGAGRVDLSAAARSPVVLQESAANFAAADPTQGGDPKSLNQPSLQNNYCIGSCSWTRTFSNISDRPVTMNFNYPAWITGSVTSVWISAGYSYEITFTADTSALPLNEWTFGTIEIDTDGGAFADGTPYPDLHIPVAVFSASSNLPEQVTFDTYRNRASGTITGLKALEITNLVVQRMGLVKGNLYNFTLSQDATNNDPFDNLSQVWYRTFSVPAGAARLVAEITSTTAADLDLYLGYDTNGNGLPESSEVVAVSATSAAIEYISQLNPPQADMWILVQNWEGANDDLVGVSLGVVPGTDQGNWQVLGPNANPTGSEFDLEVIWNEPTTTGDRLYGVFVLGSQPGQEGNVGAVGVDVRRLGDEVTKAVDKTQATVGDLLTYTITISNPNSFEASYVLEDTLPAHVTYVPGSATGGAVYDSVNRKITWSGDVEGAYQTYVYTTSLDDPHCAMPLANSGAYLDLQPFGLTPTPIAVGDTMWLTWPTLGDAIDFFGKSVGNVIEIISDGFAFFSPSTIGDEPWDNQDIPNPAQPNNLLAFLWQDLVVQYNAASNYGLTLVNLTDSSNKPVAHIAEFDDIHVYGQPTQTYDVEFYIAKQPSDNAGEYEIITAYDNINGPLTLGTIGLENEDASRWVKYAHNDQALSEITNGMAICYDLQWVHGVPHTITYQVRVNSNAPRGWLINQVNHDNNAPNTTFETTSAEVWVEVYRVYAPLIGK